MDVFNILRLNSFSFSNETDEGDKKSIDWENVDTISCDNQCEEIMKLSFTVSSTYNNDQYTIDIKTWLLFPSNFTSITTNKSL